MQLFLLADGEAIWVIYILRLYDWAEALLFRYGAAIDDARTLAYDSTFRRYRAAAKNYRYAIAFAAASM